MPPAVIAGGVMAAGTIGGAVMSSSAQKKAAKTAAAAETNAANQNAMLTREYQQQNQANLQPFLNSGAPANALVNSFLFGPQAPQATGGTGGGPTDPAWAEGALQAMGLGSRGDSVGTLQAQLNGRLEGQLPDFVRQRYDAYVAQHPQQQNALAAPTAGMDAYKTFTQSPYYQFPLQEGMRQLNTGLASHGQIKSGDAMKAAIRYGQDYGAGRMGEFIGLAQQQSDQGLRAGGAIAGVGLNALNAQTNSNNAIGQANANRAIAGGIANANLYSNIGSALGGLAGTIISPSSYRGF